MSPIIGITTYGTEERDLSNAYYKSYYSLPSLYVDAIRRAGGIPVLLPPGTTTWEPIIDGIDGLIISGGADVEPHRYGGNRHHPRLTEMDQERDRSEFALIQLLVSMPSPPPTLCICRGMQVLNVALGGTLHEHVADALEEDMHRGDDGVWADHEILVETHSVLHELMGQTTVCTTSGHHQAVKSLSEALLPIATSSDGIVEGVVHRSNRWLVGVQWHPEKTAATDPSQQRLFDQLVLEAGQRKVI